MKNSGTITNPAYITYILPSPGVSISSYSAKCMIAVLSVVYP